MARRPEQMKFSDADLTDIWEQTGNIRETSRRLHVTYKAAYKRLITINLIHSAKFDPGRHGHTARTIPEGTTLVIPDLQAPAHHPDALGFLCAVRDKFHPTNIVCIGDEVDLNFLSDFARLPEVDQPTSEWAAAQSFMRAF